MPYKRVDDAVVIEVNGKSLKVRTKEGAEETFEFSDYANGGIPKDLASGQRVSLAFNRGGYISGVQVLGVSEEEKPEPTRPEAREVDSDPQLRAQAAHVASRILATHEEPVYLKELFRYARWIELAMHEGFTFAIEELDRTEREYKERKAKQGADSKKPAAEPAQTAKQTSS